MNFVIYSAATGEILRRGICQPSTLERQAGEGEIVLEGDFSGYDYIDLQTHNPERIPPQPSSFHVFDWGKMLWIYDEAAAWASIRSQRDALISLTDWTQLPDVSDEKRIAWQGYRQQLRDITIQPDALHIEWPEEPV